MVLSTRHNVGDLNITINDDSINVDNDVKYLGVYVSSDLSWDKHISNVFRKLGHGLQILLKRVQRLHNKIFRLITDDYSWDTSQRHILSKFNIPKDVIILMVLMFLDV
jgi:hypothetical protein